MPPTPKHIHGEIGWAVIQGQHVAHHWKAATLGLVAISACGLHSKPQLLYPELRTDRCELCKIMLELPKRSKDGDS